MGRDYTTSRFTAAMKQELISRRQLSECLVKFGWMPNDPVLDLGEDFIVHVYFDGQATGVTFHIQVKSVSNLYDRRSVSGDHLLYRFYVKDLKHWEAFDSPIVVLVVWDTELKEGRWIFVDTAISDLDKRRPNWRNNKTKASVHIPWKNTTDDAGLTELKRHIGHRWYSMITQDRPVEMNVKLHFPDTEEGRTNQEAYERFIKEGSEATFVGHTIQAIEFSDWWGKWFGDYDPDDVMLVVASKGSSTIISANIAIIGSNGCVESLSNVELKNVQSGTEVIRVTNAHQTYPIHFKFTLPDSKKRKECNISFQLNDWGGDAHEALRILRFLHAFSSGGQLVITSLSFGDEKISLTIPPRLEAPTQEELQLFKQICQIQDESGHIIRVPNDGITREDALAINKLTQIFECGRISARYNAATATCDREMLEWMLAHLESECNLISIIENYTESFVELFGNEIRTGCMIKTTSGKTEMSLIDMQKQLSALAEGESVEVKIIDVEVIEEFPEIVEKIESSNTD